ncbi:MAG: hypothetical protein JWO71_2634 [Candidatus Acidoferrum typicum]|nr:hypothetical protein [Candidatus Acidoferrum typicum]
MLALDVAGLLAGGAYVRAPQPTPDQHDIHSDKKDVRHDRRDLHKDRKGLRADRKSK